MSASRTEPGRHDGSKASVGVTLTDRPLGVEVGTSAPGAADAAARPGSPTWMLGLMVVMTMNIRQTADRRTLVLPGIVTPPVGTVPIAERYRFGKPRMLVINWAVVDESDSLGWGLGPTQTGSKPCRPDGGRAVQSRRPSWPP